MDIFVVIPVAILFVVIASIIVSIIDSIGVNSEKENQEKRKAKEEAEKKRPPDEHYGILHSFTQDVIYNKHNYPNEEKISFFIELSNGIKLNLKRNGVKTYSQPPFGKMVCIKHKKDMLISMTEITEQPQLNP